MGKNKKELIITRVFDAPRELVWKAWTEPEMFKKWWGPKDFTTPHVNIDLRIGGRYLTSMKGPEGSPFDKEMWSTGEYLEVVLSQKLVVTDSFADEDGNVVPASFYGMPGTFPLETKITITFEEVDDNKTKVTLRYHSIEGIEDKMLGDMTQGWNQSFDKLAASFKGEN